ncbi:DUF6573 family protein [Rhodococcus opacus]|uniref:DUF6573 family protein n=1 Tax=Rhodococcus opacus TaxID=37919 RepID=UPI0002A4215F|nr:DUF6573 family protein [Rhodococcus opacus]ELB92470.1 hypothetical protein Rwratislav_13893 [Rhodococcus wratislaviensis IFP 2016]MDX5962870.1 DUF6573 family protein [Rhodococcus opacus]CAG7637016.1 hypothetical protein E143388_07852 [Rhodococcus opacus]
MSTAPTTADFEVIKAYSRADAITDGVLHDVTELAAQQGILYPVSIATHAWDVAVAWDDANGAMQDETGRQWDVLTMAAHALRRAKRLRLLGMQEFTVYAVPNRPGAEEPEPVTLGIAVGPGDNLEPVLTITAPADR